MLAPRRGISACGLHAEPALRTPWKRRPGNESATATPPMMSTPPQPLRFVVRMTAANVVSPLDVGTPSRDLLIRVHGPGDDRAQPRL